MTLSLAVRKILSNYNGENPGVRANLARILMHGALGGTGKIVVFPVDQGFEHGPGVSFSVNPPAYNPVYHAELAIDSGVSAYAAPLGMLEDVVHRYTGCVPFILKLNSAISLYKDKESPDQAITASVDDALRLGCNAVGFTIYPGSRSFDAMAREAKDIVAEAKSKGLAVVIWSYPRGGDLPKEAETALDVISYGAHIACILGANIVKVKFPSRFVYRDKEAYPDCLDDEANIRKIRQACFDGKRMVVFSGGPVQDTESLYAQVRVINNSDGNGSIVGRNIFQRTRLDALDVLNDIFKIYKDT